MVAQSSGENGREGLGLASGGVGTDLIEQGVGKTQFHAAIAQRLVVDPAAFMLKVDAPVSVGLAIDHQTPTEIGQMSQHGKTGTVRVVVMSGWLVTERRHHGVKDDQTSAGIDLGETLLESDRIEHDAMRAGGTIECPPQAFSGFRSGSELIRRLHFRTSQRDSMAGRPSTGIDRSDDGAWRMTCARRR